MVILIIIALLFSARSLSALQRSSSKLSPFLNFTKIGLPFDPNVINDAKCRDDVDFWTTSLMEFVNATAMQCAADDQQCLATQQTALLQNEFAAQQLDSFGRIPTNILNFNTLWEGSWEECLHIDVSSRRDYKGQFCWASVITPITSMAVGRELSLEDCASLAPQRMLTSWSVCMPRSCPVTDLSALLQTLNSNTNGMLTVCGVKCRPYDLPRRDAAFWVVTMYMAVAVLLVIVASAVDYATELDHTICKKVRSHTCVKCLLTFSMYTNGTEILSVKKRPGQIESLHCIRVVSMTWVMSGHALVMFISGDNMVKLMKLNTYFLNLAFSNAFFSVDSFLFLGGLLMTFLFIKEMGRSPHNIRSPIYWTLFYVHRIIRLSVPYFLFIGFAAVYSDYLTRGPMDADSLIPNSYCRKYWWRNVLYINNLWDFDHICLGHTWYLSIDMQIHLFAPVLLVPLCLSPIAGGISALLLLALSTGLNYWAYFKYKGPANFFGFFRPNSASFDLLATLKFQQYIYFAAWVRYTPYVIGALTGYFIAKTRGKKIRLHPLIAAALWVCAAAIAVACVYGLYDYLNGKELNIATRATYYNFSRIGWSIALAWVVIACENNWAGPIKNLMELGFWAPFSRLTYCAYLCHLYLIYMIFAMEREAIHYVSTTETYINYCLPVFCTSYAFAFLWSCAFEIPGAKLEKMGIEALLGKPRGQKPADPAKTSSVVQRPDGGETCTSESSINNRDSLARNIENGYRESEFDEVRRRLQNINH